MLLSLLLTSLLTLMELNCENLFDCEHDSLKNDTEFLPDAARKWTRSKYWHKLDQLTKEIVACGDDSAAFQLPDLIALCEVENDSVLRDLTKRSALRTAGYDYFVTDSPDERGIDVALLYHHFSFKPINHHSIRIKPVEDMKPTRDILYVSGLIVSGDTLHIFVVHAPSRYGGERSSRPFRMAVAEQLCEAIDSVRAVSPDANIIVTGDFNDGASNASLNYYYERASLHNVTANATGAHGAKGTYRYKGKWESIDHVLISSPMLPHVSNAFIFDAPFLLSEEKRYGGVKPRRTYPSYSYDSGGFSDHLPLVVRFRFF